MLVLGLQGSPRKGGNTDTFLTAFMTKAKAAGACVETIQVARSGILPCRGCGYCEKHGTCVIADDPMALEVFGMLRKADVIVAASPVYFYGISAQLKGLIDRCQTFWSRKYVYKLKDPLSATRKAILFSVAASRGRQLFDGIHLTAKYFFDAIDAAFVHTMTYRGIEAKGAIAGRKDIDSEIEDAIAKVIAPQLDRTAVLFVSKQGACRAPMAAAITQQTYGEQVRTEYCGTEPGLECSKPMVEKMTREGVDLAYRTPQSIGQIVFGTEPDLTITIGEGLESASVPGRKKIHWSLPDSATGDDETMRRLYQATIKSIATIKELCTKNNQQRSDHGRTP